MWVGLISILFFSAISAVAQVDLKFSRQFQQERQKLIRTDLRNFAQLPIKSDKAELQKLFGLSEINSQSLLKWFSERAKIIIDENHPVGVGNIFDFERRATIKTETLMVNVGAMVYQVSQESGRSKSISIDGVGIIPVISGRVGILQTGNRFFQSLYKKDKSENIQDVVHTAFRVSTLFHEARHSDNSGFIHSICPDGHPYQGLPACDRAANGPYHIAAQILDMWIQSCVKCSAGEIEALQIIRNDNLQRVLSPGVVGGYKTGEMRLCELEKILLGTSSDQCKTKAMWVGDDE